MDFDKKSMYTMTDYELQQEMQRKCHYFIEADFDPLDPMGQNTWEKWRNRCYDALLNAPIELPNVPLELPNTPLEFPKKPFEPPDKPFELPNKLFEPPNKPFEPYDKPFEPPLMDKKKPWEP